MKIALPKILFAICVTVFAFFPLTDTDIWWHLASARDFLENGLATDDPFCWTASKSPWINVHLYFQLALYGVEHFAGTFGLVALKALLWGLVAFLWILPVKRKILPVHFALLFAFAFLFRYAFECRPILLSMLFLGIFWNLLPQLEKRISAKWILSTVVLIAVEWIWVRTQGLFPLGFVLAFGAIAFSFQDLSLSGKVGNGIFFFLLLLTPLAHTQGVQLWLYPLELLNRLVGGNASSQIFSQQIAENRAPTTLLAQGENQAAMIALLVGIFISAFAILRHRHLAKPFQIAWLVIGIFLAATAERNLTLFFFPFASIVLSHSGELLSLRSALEKNLSVSKKMFSTSLQIFTVLGIAFVVGTFVRSLPAYFENGSFKTISAERLPIGAVEFMRSNPQFVSSRLFNDDRSGGYIEWKLLGVKTFADGRFILKDSTFLANYLKFSEKPEEFFSFADSLSIQRVLLPVRYIPLWIPLAKALEQNPEWTCVYQDSVYAVWDHHRILVMDALTSDYHEKIAVLDIRDSSVHVLASGNDILHPDLWKNK